MTKENADCWLTERCSRVDCDGFCLRHFKLSRMYDDALMSLRQRRHVRLYLEAGEPDGDAFAHLAAVERGIVGFVGGGGNLYISSSNTGNGKTSWALRMVQAYFDRIWYQADSSCHALFVHVPRFLLSLKDNISQRNEYAEHIKANATSADLVVWDEIGTKGLTQFEHENILNYVNARLDAGKANIYTSNLSNDELRSAIGDRLYSRIALASDCVVLRGKDKRGLR